MKDQAAGRIVWIDLARSAALLAMALYHLVFDLEMFGYLDRGTATSGGWAVWARLTAGSFLFIAGGSLVLAQGGGLRAGPFLRRLAVVAAAAAAITVATLLATPQMFIFFGILHAIALFSVLGLAFLRVPPALTLAVAALVVAAPLLLRSEMFDTPWLWWVGLQTIPPISSDYEPVFPWFGPFLAGMALTRVARVRDWLRPTGPVRPWIRRLAWPGRHSLAVYLIHQPVLIALVWLAAQAVPPDTKAGFIPEAPAILARAP